MSIVDNDSADLLKIIDSCGVLDLSPCSRASLEVLCAVQLLNIPNKHSLCMETNMTPNVEEVSFLKLNASLSSF